MPNIFNGIFVTNSDKHDHKTRQRTKLHVISHRIKVREISIKRYGINNGILWRNLLSNHDRFIFLKRDVKH